MQQRTCTPLTKLLAQWGIHRLYQEIKRPGTALSIMRQICVLQWEEIKTKNSGAMHHF